MIDKINQLKNKIENKSAEEVLQIASQEFGSRIVFASSLGEEDQVITDMVARLAPGIEIFTLDTGRLPQETYDLIAQTQKRYPQLKFKIYFPDYKKIEEMVASKGINLFYESVENRKLCCGLRKVEPLGRALANADSWITGLRRDQSVTRADLDVVEWDEGNKKIKINPLLDWSLEDVHRYIKEHKVDVNP